MLTTRRVGLSMLLLCAATIFAVVTEAPVARDGTHAESATLTPAEAEEVHGGVAADIEYPPSNNYAQWYDNLRFQVAIDSGSSSSSFWMGASADGAMTLPFQYMTTNSSGNGTFHYRTRWPHAAGVKYDLAMKYYWDGTWYDCSGDHTRTDQYLHSSVRVHRIIVHNTNSGGYTTTWSALAFQTITDNSSYFTPTSSSNTMDGVYGQCGPLQTNGIDKTQWRWWPGNTISIPSNCSDLTSEYADCGGCAICGGVQTCYEAFIDAANQTSNDDVHVYVVDELGCSQGGVTAGAHSTTINGMKIVVVADQFGPDSDNNLATVLLSHEIGHHALGPTHRNGQADNCNQGTNYGVKNVMCADLGRVFDDGQCDSIRTTMPFLDRN